MADNVVRSGDRAVVRGTVDIGDGLGAGSVGTEDIKRHAIAIVRRIDQRGIADDAAGGRIDHRVEGSRQSLPVGFVADGGLQYAPAMTIVGAPAQGSDVPGQSRRRDPLVRSGKPATTK